MLVENPKITHCIFNAWLNGLHSDFRNKVFKLLSIIYFSSVNIFCVSTSLLLRCDSSSRFSISVPSLSRYLA